MIKIIWKSNRFMMRRHYIVQVVFFYLLTYVFIIISLPILLIFASQKIEGIQNAGPKHVDFISTSILAPILETLIFQYLIFKIVQKVKTGSDKYLWYIGISAVLFGLSHCYSASYIVFATALGFLLAYILYFYHRNMNKAFWTTALVHALHNATSYILIHFKIAG